MLKWHAGQVDIIGASVKLNADCIIHATLEDDKVILKILYSFGYRLGPDTDRRINKVNLIFLDSRNLNFFEKLGPLILMRIYYFQDYLKRIKLFRARASPIYNIVAFEDSHDIDK